MQCSAQSLFALSTIQSIPLKELHHRTHPFFIVLHFRKEHVHDRPKANSV